MIIGRTEPLDYKSVFETIVNTTAEYVKSCKLETMVLGLSGGLDSTVCAAICSKVAEKTGTALYGVSLPCSTNKEDENNSADLAGKEFCNVYIKEGIQETFECIEKLCDTVSTLPSTKISQGNIKARLRMITLYDIASKMRGIVIDTDNLTEHFLGFWTLHGDDADFNPIGGLWKHEVYDLAKYMKDNIYKDSKALEQAIALMPTDGNGVKEGGDLAQIAPGKTYDDVDEILHAWVGLDSRIKDIVIKNYFDYGVFKKLCEKHGYETVEAVILRSVRSEFKRKQRPFIIDVYRGLICEKDGKIIG